MVSYSYNQPMVSYSYNQPMVSYSYNPYNNRYNLPLHQLMMAAEITSICRSAQPSPWGERAAMPLFASPFKKSYLWWTAGIYMYLYIYIYIYIIIYL